MAKRIVDEEMRFNIIVNGNEAQKELFDLERSTRKLIEQNKAYREEQAKLVRQGKKNSEEYKRLSAAIKENNATIASNKTQMKTLQDQIGITGLSMAQLRKKAAMLRGQLANAIPGSEAYKRYQADLKAVNARLSELRVKAKAAKTSLGSIADGFNRFAALGASVIAAGTGIVLSIQKMIDYNGKLADAQSNVQKTTGLTKKEVDELTKSFGALKTRTARIELLGLAEEAGRLGIEGVSNIKDFVEVANQMKVALGDDLGDEQIREVGKMVNIYKVGERTGRDFKNSLLSMGSAINEVSASGANQASFLVDFVKRTAGISDVANIAAEDMIGLAAAFDEAGQSQEISATAINKFFGSAAENVDKFAKVAGVSIEEYSRLLREDANEALILFLKGLKQGNPSLEEMAMRLDGIELGGTRGAQAISALSANIENLEEKQQIANRSLLEATSLTDEYNLKNNNLAGTLEKIQKRITAAFSSEAVIDGLNVFVEWFAKFIGASEDADGKVTKFRNRLVALLKSILIITAAIVSYKTAVQLAALWTGTLDKTSRLYIITQKVQAASTTVLRTATLLLAAGYNLVTGNIVRARAAMSLLNKTMLLSPIGLIVAAVTAAAGAYLLFSENTKKAVTSQSLYNDAMKEAQSNTAETIKSKQLLLDVARDETLSLEQRQGAIDELNRTVPEYNNQLTIEKANTDAAKAALDKHIESLKQSAVTHVLLERIKKKAVELADLENSALEDNIKWYEKLWNGIKSGGQVMSTASANVKTANKNRNESIATTKEEIKALEELYQTQLKNNPNSVFGGDSTTTTTTTTSTTTPTTSPGTKPKSNAAKNAQQRARELLRIQREAEDRKLELMQDSFEKQLLQEDFNHFRKIEDLQDKLISEELIKKAFAEGNDNLANSYIEQNKAINSQIESELELHEIRKATITEKGIGDSLAKKQQAFEAEQQARQTAHNNAMAALGDNEKAKQKLQEEFDKESLEKNKAHLEELLQEFNNILQTSEFQGIDLEILSDDQLAQIKTKLADLGLSISQVNMLLAAMKGKGGEEEINLGAAGGMDILGFTADQWLATFENLDTTEQKLAAVGMGVQGLVNAFGKYYEFINQKETRDLQKFEKNNSKKKERQKNLLDSGMINRRQYDAAIQALDAEADKKKAELEYKQAKRAWKMQLLQAIAGAAMATINGFNSTPFLPVGLIMGALAATLGTIQVATIAKNKPVRGYEDGYYNVTREQDGKNFNAAFGGESRTGLVDKPTVFLAGEGGKNFPEMIIDGNSYKQISPMVKNALDSELARVKGFQNGYYQSQTAQPEFSGASSSDTAIMATLMETNQLLRDLRDNPIMAVMSEEYRNIMKLQTALEKTQKLKDKSKR